MKLRAKAKKNQVVNEEFTTRLSREEIAERIAAVEATMKACTWCDLEVHGKFGKEEKISFISDDMLIVGCDIGSESHFIRAIDTRGRELSRDAFEFSNSSEGYELAKAWMLELAARYGKKQIVMGLEPTGHYWFCIAAWMVTNEISVVQVNPYAVKQTKEVEDNSQDKNDRKDPKLIANLVKDGNYGMPYLPVDVYAEMRVLNRLRDQLTEDRNRAVNRLHRMMRIYFPEYKDAFGKFDGIFTLLVMKEAPFPEDILKKGSDGLKELWQAEKLRGGGYQRAGKIVECAKNSVGLKEGLEGAKLSVRIYAEEVMRLDRRLAEAEQMLEEQCRKIPHAENVVKINGIGETILCGIISEMGDISRFDDVKEIQKLSGLGLVACSSGKHKGETRISHRGRKRLRYWLFQAARSAVAHAAEFRELHEYYTTRAENPLKKLQSLIVIACKILRVIYAILKNGTEYDPKKMLLDIRRAEQRPAMAA